MESCGSIQSIYMVPYMELHGKHGAIVPRIKSPLSYGSMHGIAWKHHKFGSGFGNNQFLYVTILVTIFHRIGFDRLLNSS